MQVCAGHHCALCRDEQLMAVCTAVDISVFDLNTPTDCSDIYNPLGDCCKFTSRQAHDVLLQLSCC
jgi:hypothetical protein